MAHFDGRGFRLHFVEEGEGKSVVFVHEMVMDHTVFAAQFEDLPDKFRCLAYDLRGHGRSEVTGVAWTMQDLVADLVAFIEGTRCAPAHLVGLGVGGMTALRAAVQREDLVRSLVLINTNADAEEDEWAQMYRGFRRTILDDDGISAELARQTVPLFFSTTYAEAHPETIEVHVDRLTKMKAGPVVAALDAVLGRESILDRLDDVRVPTLVIHGEQDQAVPISKAEAVASGIRGAELVKIPDAGHTSVLEAPDIVNQALDGFFGRVKR